MSPSRQSSLYHDMQRSARRGSFGRSPTNATTSTARFQVVLALGRVEAWLLGRSLLVLTGLAAGGILVWDVIHRGEPLWWNAAWEIGYGQMILSMTVLAAAQLAAGRDQRDGMRDIYGSLPVSAATRTVAHLMALVGAAPASLVLIGAATTFLEVRGDVIGRPGPAVLVDGVLLVIAAGTIGVAIGRRFPHPLAGLVGAIVWLVPFSQSNRFSGAVTWLFPWVIPDQLKWLPHPLPGYPPSVGHGVELAGIAALAAVVALVLGTKVLRRRMALMAAGALALAVIYVAAAAELEPIPTASLNHLFAEVADPAPVQHCTTTNGVRYCLYPGFHTVLWSLQTPVNGVLALLPIRPAGRLSIAQAAALSLPDASLTRGHSEQQLAAWRAEVQRSSANAPAASTVYVTAGAWPTGGAQAAARFDLALASAEWGVGLPPSTGNPTQHPQCVAFDQAREAVAIWLAMTATHTDPGQLGSHGLATGRGNYRFVEVRNTPVRAWTYPGENSPYLASLGPQTTATGYLLAKAMWSLPIQKVTDILHVDWAYWTNWHTTDARLAAALGIPLPTAPALDFEPSTGRAVSQPAGSIPSQPVCTT